MINLTEILKERLLVFDGGMGTEQIAEEGVRQLDLQFAEEHENKAVAFLEAVSGGDGMVGRAALAVGKADVALASVLFQRKDALGRRIAQELPDEIPRDRMREYFAGGFVFVEDSAGKVCEQEGRMQAVIRRSDESLLNG